MVEVGVTRDIRSQSQVLSQQMKTYLTSGGEQKSKLYIFLSGMRDSRGKSAISRLIPAKQ